MNVGSLFSGIGGFDLGLERAGMRVAWQCEADEFCQRALAERWPGVPCYPDVRELTGATVEPVDVLCGGFPCQDISLAGKGAGIGGARSGLWGEYARLVGELRPRYVVVENVAALLTRGLGRVLGDLAALGYDAEWDCLPASAFGAPHQRDRVWLIAYPGRERAVADSRGQRGPTRREAKNVAGSQGEGQGTGQERQRDGHAPDDCRSVVAHPEREGELQPRWPLSKVGGWTPYGCEPGGVADTNIKRREGRRPGEFSQGPDSSLQSSGLGEVGRGRGALQDTDECAVQPWRIGGRVAQAGSSEWWSVEPPVGRVAHGVPDRLAQLAALGNALVPQIAEWLGTQILDYERSV